MKNFKIYNHLRIITEEGAIAHGDYRIDNYILRIKEGFLNDDIGENGEILPAIENDDFTHIEHWKDGVLHYENAPAVIDLIDNYNEWWINGKIIDEKLLYSGKYDTK